MRRAASGELIVDGAVTARTIAAEAVVAEAIAAGAVSVMHLTVAELLTLTGRGAFAAFKQSPDDGEDGLFFGRVTEGAQTKFALAASRKAAGGLPQEVRFGSDGFRLTNAQFYFAMSAPDPVVRRTTDLATTTLTGAKMVRIPAAIGGGGGGGGENAGGNGGDTIVRLYDGATLKHTITAGGGQGSGGSLSGSPAPGLDPGNRGGGGGGAIYIDGSGASRRGRGGARGSVVSRDWIDVSSWATPRIQITIGAAGAANNTGSTTNPATNGVAGMVSYQVLSAADVRANPVPLGPTAQGSFSKIANTAGSFPDLGPGMWTLLENSGEPFGLGTVSLGGGRTQSMNTPRQLTFTALETPTYTGGASNRTISYMFFGMEIVG